MFHGCCGYMGIYFSISQTILAIVVVVDMVVENVVVQDLVEPGFTGPWVVIHDAPEGEKNRIHHTQMH